MTPNARGLARRFYDDRSWPFQLARYLTIGAFVLCIDVGTFALMLRAGWPLMIAATISYALAIATHFTLNKYVNFRAHERPVQYQAIAYAIVAIGCWFTTLLVIKVAVAWGAPPLGGKLLAIAVNVPIGFVGHRHLTFGRGIAATLRQLFTHRADS